MSETTLTNTHMAQSRPGGWRGIAADWSSDQRAFKNVSWGKAMMWIFLLSDTFIFGCFLLSYMTARMPTKVAPRIAVSTMRAAVFLRSRR